MSALDILVSYFFTTAVSLCSFDLKSAKFNELMYLYFLTIFFYLFTISLPVQAGVAGPGKPCSQLLQSQAPIPPALSSQEQEALRTDILMGALRPQNSLMLKAWEPNESGFLIENREFDYQAFILTQIREGLDLNARDPKGRTALMHAASSGYSRMMWTLLRLGADLSLKDKDGRTASDLSMLLRDYDSQRTDMFYVQNYLSYRGYFIADQVMELFKARDFDELGKLFAKGVYVDTFDLGLGKSLLTRAAEDKDLEMMIFLLKQGANPNFGSKDYAQHQYPVLVATSNCHTEAIEILLEHGADLNAKGGAPFDINPVRQVIWDYASEAKNQCPKLEMLEWLLNKGADPNAHLDSLPTHQRQPLDTFIKELYWEPRSQDRRSHIEALLKTRGVNTQD